jgi:hypothetical protein
VPVPAQFFRHPGRIGVDHLADEEFIADADDLEIHGTKILNTRTDEQSNGEVRTGLSEALNFNLLLWLS